MSYFFDENKFYGYQNLQKEIEKLEELKLQMSVYPQESDEKRRESLFYIAYNNFLCGETIESICERLDWSQGHTEYIMETKEYRKVLEEVKNIDEAEESLIKSSIESDEWIDEGNYCPRCDEDPCRCSDQEHLL